MKKVICLGLLALIGSVSAEAKLLCSATCISNNRSFKQVIATGKDVVEAREKMKSKCTNGELTITTHVRDLGVILAEGDWNYECEEI